MNFKQKILKAFYPLIMRLSKSESGKGKVLINPQKVRPKDSFYDLNVMLNNGTVLHFDQLKGKKVLLVNTASNCGYTGQYAELQQLHEKTKGKLAILGFPANDFQEQEKGADEEIAQFCQVNFGVDFPLSQKGRVIAGDGQHPVYQWLTQKDKNGWNAHQPDWNFSKFLVDEKGILTHYFGPAISPVGEEVSKALQVK
jgi:glutathione peroxidase